MKQILCFNAVDASLLQGKAILQNAYGPSLRPRSLYCEGKCGSRQKRDYGSGSGVMTQRALRIDVASQAPDASDFPQRRCAEGSC